MDTVERWQEGDLAQTRPCLRPDACPYRATAAAGTAAGARDRWTAILRALLPGDLSLADSLIEGIAVEAAAARCGQACPEPEAATR